MHLETVFTLFIAQKMIPLAEHNLATEYIQYCYAKSRQLISLSTVISHILK